jgi:hypothetical protein
VKVEIAKRTDTLRLPNAALRFRPTAEIFAALNQPIPPEVQFAGGRGGRGGQGGGGGRNGGGGNRNTGGAAPSSAAPAASAQQGVSPGSSAAPGGRGGNAGGSGDQAGDRRGGGRGGFDPARQMERFQAMSRDEQKQFIARMKDRGQDASAFEKAAKPASAASALKTKYGAPQSAQTIDALFAPLPPVESRGRAWVFMDHQLKSVNLRLGITDGTNTELLSEELQQNQEVVTSVTGVGATRNIGGQQGTGNPLIPQRGGPPGGPGGGGRGRG